LLDEIEKAHPDVSNILLQVLDDGRLTDGQGRTVDFKNTVLIMTTNASQDDLKATMRPEFLNRIDEIVKFNSLSEKEITNIVRVQLREVENRLAEKRIQIEFDEKAIQFLAKRGFDPDYGARPLKRTIQTEVLNPLARLILENKVGSVVRVSAGKDSLEFHK